MRKFFFALSILIIFPFSGYSQVDDEAWKYAQTIREQGLKDVLTIIASDQMEGRETGTEGQRRAAIYIENKFKEIGLKAPAGLDGYQQKYPLYRDSMMNERMTIGTTKLTMLTDYILLSGSSSSANLMSNQIEFAGYGIDDDRYSDYTGKNVKGKIVVMLNGEPKSEGRFLISGSERPSAWSFGTTRKVDAAAKHGAIAVIFTDLRQHEIPRNLINSAKQSNLYFPRENNPGGRVPAAYILPEFFRDIFPEKLVESITDAYNTRQPLNKIKAQVRKNIGISYTKKRFSVLASNVIGYIEGTDLKDQYLVLTSHYDHLGIRDGQIYYGADDDGSGTTGVIAMAEAFMKAKKDGHGPRRNIVFMTVSGEEKGLWGSEYYSEHPVFPLDKTTGSLNTDMIGRIDPGRTIGDSTNYVYVIGNDKLSSDLDPLAKQVNDKYMNLELDFKYNDPDDPERIYYRSDHFNFARKGVPVIFYFDGIHKDYHKPTDTVEKINFDLMEKRVRYTFLTAWDIANRDQMLKRDIPLPEMTR